MSSFQTLAGKAGLLTKMVEEFFIAKDWRIASNNGDRFSIRIEGEIRDFAETRISVFGQEFNLGEFSFVSFVAFHNSNEPIHEGLVQIVWVNQEANRLAAVFGAKSFAIVNFSQCKLFCWPRIESEQ